MPMMVMAQWDVIEVPTAPQLQSSKEAFDVVEQMPSFPGGMSALQSYLATHTVYPENAAANGVQGRVIVQIVVEKTGKISDVWVVRSVHPLLDYEAMRVVRGMPRWNPGMQNGKPVPVKYTVPIAFKLS